jgi:fructose/tagatose bisphosphate aldolase
MQSNAQYTRILTEYQEFKAGTHLDYRTAFETVDTLVKPRMVQVMKDLSEEDRANPAKRVFECLKALQKMKVIP